MEGCNAFPSLFALLRVCCLLPFSIVCCVSVRVLLACRLFVATWASEAKPHEVLFSRVHLCCSFAVRLKKLCMLLVYGFCRKKKGGLCFLKDVFVRCFYSFVS
jgi:hypothetical protein